MVPVDGQGLSLGNQLYSAAPNEARLAEKTPTAIRVTRGRRGGRPRQKPRRLIADRAYDSEPLREQLAARGIELVAPHRGNRRKPRTQDGRAARRYRRRWKSVIPAKRGKKTWRFHGVRAQMPRTFPRRLYRRRSLIESLFSSVKRKLSARAPGRSLRTQKRQALLLGLSFNLYRLWHRYLFTRMSTEPNEF